MEVWTYGTVRSVRYALRDLEGEGHGREARAALHGARILNVGVLLVRIVLGVGVVVALATLALCRSVAATPA